MFDLLATLMAWFYDVWPSYGMAIVLLTLTVMLVVTPLTLKGTRSMLELQAHQPELRRIQTQYRDDRQKMNEELMKFYQEHKINPVGGCLPLLIQLPVFIILYNVLRGLTSRTSLLEATLAGDPSQAGHFDPKYLEDDTALSIALHSTSEMVSWGIDLSRSAVQAMGEGFGTAVPYIMLILAATAASYYQQAQIQRRSPGAVNPQMQMITRVMPLFITFISLTLPAALVVYFVVSGLYRIGQQAIITRHIYTDEVKERLAAARAAGDTGPITTTAKDAKDTKDRKAAAPSAAAPAPGGFLSRLLGPSAPATGNGATSSATPAPPPAARTSGRVTPPGSRPAASRKRKKRK
jgi:YidC/Oxa1 family membrane protein insertase